MAEDEMNEQSQASMLVTLEETVKSHISTIDRLGKEAKEFKEMMESTLYNDTVYQNHEKALKEATKIKNTTKSEIMKRPEVASIAEKLKDVKIQIKEMQSALSDYLREFQRLSGSNEIESSEGEVLDIVSVVKLVRRKR